ncbi:MAG TPA: MFS transporter, partial [Tepidisphaeraceae bacterium]|nr:MFS transporter [Tepidisphaeraceae bacterium]
MDVPAPQNENRAIPLDYGRSDGPRLHAIIRAMRHRNYRLFFAGQLVSLCGTFLTQVAMVWLVYSLTGSGKILGFTAFAGQIPTFLLGPFAGVWVDRLNRRKLIVTTQVLAMVQSFALAALLYFFTGRNNIVVPGLISLAFIQGLINAFDMPGRQAFLVEMVTDRDDLANAIALNSTMVHGARLVGPALAGFLIHYTGATWCFLLDGCSYIAVIAALLAMKLKPFTPKPRRGSVLAELREGFNYVWTFAPIRTMLLLMALISLTGIPAFTVLMPIFAKALAISESQGSETLGFLMGASAAGALIGAIYLASRKSVVGLGRVIAIAAAFFGTMLIAFSFSRHLWLSLLIVPLVGCAMLINFASANTVLQTLTEDEKRGRVMSFFTMAFVGMTPWGNLLSGISSDYFGGGIQGASRTIEIAGGICIIAAISFATKLPALRKVVRPIYTDKGIISASVAGGLETATEVV